MEQSDITYRNVGTVTSPAPHSYHFTGEDRSDATYSQAQNPIKGKKRGFLVWGMGGTILSAVGFVALALFEQYNSSLAELRGDLKHFNEISSELVKKDGLHKCIDRIHECNQELQGLKGSKAEVERELATSIKEREVMAREVQNLRERLAAVEGRQAGSPIVIQLPAGEKQPAGGSDRLPKGE